MTKRREEYLRKYSNEHKEDILKYQRTYRQNHPEKVRFWTRGTVNRGRERYRQLVLKSLGAKCNNPNCPIPSEKMDLRGLQIDHVNGGGQEQRKKTNYRSYLWYKKIYEEILEGSKDYQLLCAYCNWIKRSTNKEFNQRREQ